MPSEPQTSPKRAKLAMRPSNCRPRGRGRLVRVAVLIAMALAGGALSSQATAATNVPYCGQVASGIPHCNIGSGAYFNDAGLSLNVYNAVRMFTGQNTTSICSNIGGVVCLKESEIYGSGSTCYAANTALTTICYTGNQNFTTRARCRLLSGSYPWANCWKNRL